MNYLVINDKTWRKNSERQNIFHMYKVVLTFKHFRNAAFEHYSVNPVFSSCASWDNYYYPGRNALFLFGLFVLLKLVDPGPEWAWNFWATKEMLTTSAETADQAALEQESPGEGQRPQLCTANTWGAGLAPAKGKPSVQTSCSTHSCTTPNTTALLCHVSLPSSQSCKESEWGLGGTADYRTHHILNNWLKK